MASPQHGQHARPNSSSPALRTCARRCQHCDRKQPANGSKPSPGEGEAELAEGRAPHPCQSSQQSPRKPEALTAGTRQKAAFEGAARSLRAGRGRGQGSRDAWGLGCTTPQVGTAASLPLSCCVASKGNLGGYYLTLTLTLTHRNWIRSSRFARAVPQLSEYQSGGRK